jgi:hypothetical protein
MKKYIPLVALFICGITMKSFGGNFWNAKAETPEMLSGNRQIIPDHYLVYSLQVQAMKNELQQAPMEFTTAAATAPVALTLPMPDGTWMSFAMVESPVMHPELAAKYPFIKTYSGRGIQDQSAWVRIDFTQFGFHAMMRVGQNDIFIDPYNMQTTSDYLVYYRKDLTQSSNKIVCAFDDLPENLSAQRMAQPSLPASVNRSIGTNLRTYRLALACTGEYAAYYGGTVAGALSGMVTSINRVTGVYESEVDIRLNLIANTDTLIFLNANTDPYTNNNGSTMLGQNQTTVTARIGSANYDIGHVFSTGGGGIASLGCVCNNGNKAQGVTGSPTPINDAFNIDYVAHEMGHQFGGNHTFNSVSGSCNGNRASNAAYEPGSGVTIMGYAGICGSDDLAAHSIAYFHTKSFDEIVNYSTLSTGNSCPVNTLTFNNAPYVSPGGTFNVPVGTAFKLNGSGTDPDGDSLTYSWEQFDLGPAGTWNNPSGNAPIYRSYAPATSALRYFPKISVLLNQTNVKGELITTYARNMHFRLIARDNKPNGGGVTYNDTITTVNVIQTSAPFAVTYPNVTGISWPALSTQTITWEVGGTDAAPFNEQLVNIYLSINNGTSFPITIATAVPNNGSYTFTVPNNQSNTCRVWVEGASSGSIFFDINDKAFAIVAPVGLSELKVFDQLTIYPNPAQDRLWVYLGNQIQENVTLKMYGVNGQQVLEQLIVKDKNAAQVELNTKHLEKGLYFLKAESGSGSAIRKVVIQ